MSKTDKEKLAAVKAAAKAKAAEGKKDVSIDTITFRKNSGSEIVFNVLKRAKTPITLKVLTERSVKSGLKNPARAKKVVDWFKNNDIAIFDNNRYELAPVKENSQADNA